MCVSTPHRFWISKFHRENTFLGMEILPPLPLIAPGPTVVRGVRVSLYLDNNTAGNALNRGDFANPFIASMVCVFWMLVGELPIDIRIGIVCAKVGPSDLPTRNVKAPFEVLDRAQYTRLFSPLCEKPKIFIVPRNS